MGEKGIAKRQSPILPAKRKGSKIPLELLSYMRPQLAQALFACSGEVAWTSEPSLSLARLGDSVIISESASTEVISSKETRFPLRFVSEHQ
jgi:hypothetical protein